MNVEEQEDDQFASLMAAYDEALAAGTQPSRPADTPVELQSRLQKGLVGIRLLRRMLGSQPAAESAGPTGEPLRRLGRFELERELGRGGFGIVYLARDPLLARAVALKVPRPESLLDSDLRQRFLREAQTAAGLDHPNVIPIYDAGEIGPVCYLTAAYCPGPSLAGWLREQVDPVAPREAAGLVATLAGAIHYAHGRGVVHRDLKPANILLQELTTHHSPLANYQPKITDFGIAKVLDGMTVNTTTGVMLGTPAYMAPEQTQNKGDRSGLQQMFTRLALSSTRC
jgi:serine/threonine protein kinase